MFENAPLIVDHVFPSPVQRVWHAWTDADELSRWFAKRANVQAVRGGPYELFWEPENPERNSTIGCRLTYVEPYAWLAFTWRGPSVYDDPMNVGNPPPRPTYVTVQFISHGPETAVHIRHVGWETGARWAEAREWHVRSWEHAVANLDAVLRNQPVPYPFITAEG